MMKNNCSALPVFVLASTVAMLLAVSHPGPVTGATTAAVQTELIGGFPPAEAIRLGARMYREGILPSGEPMKAIVKGDIPVDGNLTCASCHNRSGFGSSEGTIRTPPIDGTRLYAPLSKFKGIPSRGRSRLPEADTLYRPAYTDETLARVIRIGEDPTGRSITSTMPIYFLNDRDIAIMVYYLKNLSTGTQPGVSEDTLKFATIITDDVSQSDRDSMLGPLHSFIEHWRLSKNMEKATRAQAYMQEGSQQMLRKLSLSVWELKGPAETWQSQLENYYKNEPVFAVLAGISGQDWTPIHLFCEQHAIPSIFPITDYPVISKGDWYTLYLSKGLYQEGEAAAKYLHRAEELRKDRAIVQVFRMDRSGRALAKGFEDAWTGRGNKAPDNFGFEKDKSINETFWNELARSHPHAVVLIWLAEHDFPSLNALVSKHMRPDAVFASAGLLGKNIYTLPGKESSSLFIAYPYTLPQDAFQSRNDITTSMNISKIPMPNPEVAYKMQSLFATLNGPLAMLRSSVYRDYFLELIESQPDMSLVPATYPRLSFGTGQRYASKGCYIVQFSEGPEPGLAAKSDWVVQ